MNRRSFLQDLAIAASALAVDPERLLWTPGKKTLFIPQIEESVPALFLVTWTENGVKILGPRLDEPDPLPPNTIVAEELVRPSLLRWAEQQDRRVFRLPTP